MLFGRYQELGRGGEASECEVGALTRLLVRSVRIGPVRVGECGDDLAAEVVPDRPQNHNLLSWECRADPFSLTRICA